MQFRIVFEGGCLPWMDTSDWTVADMEQWKEFPNYTIEYRHI